MVLVLAPLKQKQRGKAEEDKKAAAVGHGGNHHARTQRRVTA